MTGLLGNSGFLFPRISVFLSTSSRETLGFSGGSCYRVAVEGLERRSSVINVIYNNIDKLTIVAPLDTLLLPSGCGGLERRSSVINASSVIIVICNNIDKLTIVAPLDTLFRIKDGV